VEAAPHDSPSYERQTQIVCDRDALLTLTFPMAPPRSVSQISNGSLLCLISLLALLQPCNRSDRSIEPS
jgi:hypothetical protein